MKLTEDQKTDIQAAIGTGIVLLLLAVLLSFCGCATTQPQVVEVPVEVPTPYPVIVTPELPPPPVCDDLLTCPRTIPEGLQCAVVNVGILSGCISVWQDWWDQVDAQMKEIVE